MEAQLLNYEDLRKREDGVYYIMVKTKGNIRAKDSQKISERAYYLIMSYLRKKELPLEPTSPIFTTLNRSTSGERIALQTISRMVKKRLEAIGLTGHQYCCHSLRHTAASQLVEKNIPIGQIKRFLRHKSELTSKLYTHLVDEKKFEENNPQDILGDQYDIPDDLD
jgi:integrase